MNEVSKDKINLKEAYYYGKRKGTRTQSPDDRR